MRFADGASNLFAAQAHDHVDPGDFHAFRRLGQLAEIDQLLRQVDQKMGLFGQEMLVIGEVGVEIGFRAVHGDFAQQARRSELVQRIIDGGEGNRRMGGQSLLLETLRRDVAVA